MKKKLVALMLCLAMAATAVVGASLAYFTDTDQADNVFTSGNVQIRLIEQEYGKDGMLKEFASDAHLLLPYTGKNGDKDHDTNYVDKMVNVKNTGANAAYIRVLVAIPTALNETLHVDWNSGDWTKAPDTFDILRDEVRYTVHTVTYNVAVDAEAATQGVAMRGVYLDPAVDYDPVKGYTLNGNAINFDLADFQIPVVAQAVQQEGFTSADEAFATAKISLPEGWAEYTEPQV